MLALGIFIVVLGHVAFALTHRDALRSMFKGWVTEVWASRHASAWLKELKEEEPPPRKPDSVPTG